MGGANGYAQFGEMHCATSDPPGHQATIGIMAHEMGHLLGLPDLYDIDNSSKGIGDWSLMAGGSWNSSNLQAQGGDSPALLDPWSKYFLGWVTPIQVTTTMVGQSIPASANNPTVYQFLAGSALTGTGQYFLVENRQLIDYDVGLPGAGLLIWHVEESKTTNSQECIPGGTPACNSSVHYKVALVQADNSYGLERGQSDGDRGDPYPGTAGNRSFTPSSLPNSNLYNGTLSNVYVTDISDSGLTMTATLSLAAPPPRCLQPIAMPAIVNGTLTTDDCRTSVRGSEFYADQYVFSGTAGRRLAIALTSVAFDTFLYLLGPSGQVILLDDDGGGGLNSRIPPFGGFISLPVTGTYTIVATSFAANGTGAYALSVVVPASGDFNGDGKSDILWRHSSGEVHAWLMNGTSRSSGGLLDDVDASWTVQGTGDFNGDGKADVLWRHSSGLVYVWFMNGGSIASAGSLGNVGSDWVIAGIGDFNGDGKADILWRNASGIMYLWLIDGLRIIGAGSPASVGPDWTFEGVGDFNGDGKSDILWRNTSGLVYFWLMNGTSIIGAGIPGDRRPGLDG